LFIVVFSKVRGGAGLDRATLSDPPTKKRALYRRFHSHASRFSKILVQRFPADSKFTGDLSLLSSSQHTCLQGGDLIGGQGLFSTSIGTSFFGESNPFPLPFSEKLCAL